MPIKDTDGNVVRLRGPNPLMKDQEVWDKSKLTLINMYWEPLIIEDNKKTVKDKVEAFREQPKQEVPVAVEVPTVVIPEPKPKEVLSDKTALLIEKHKVMFHCLPRKTVTDELYGTTRQVYVNKFTFEGIIVKQEDLRMVFWSELLIEAGSIVYPMTSEKRWWKTTTIEEKSGGYMVDTIISDISPSFGD